MRSLLAYSTTSSIEEKLTLRIRADNSGDVYIPTAGYSPEGTQDCAYNWMITIDGGEPKGYSGTGSTSGKIRVGYGLTPLSTHTVTIRPTNEDYGWLRAFGYKGSGVASSLVNIISDKSYKGFAMSDMYSGDYFKAYQYYGCTNLINTDEELLPDTLLIIGDKYRYYEYAGCTKLVTNADEKILKSVRVIGDDYRAYQYLNCSGITRIYMRAINWASVGKNYRQNQFSNMGSDKSQMNVYIEGGIEEGGSWGLIDSRVKNIYVYDGLVADYKTKLSTITSSKIKKNPDWDSFEYEFIEYVGIADSTGKIRIPVGGYSTSFTQDCAYDWYVSIDGGEPEEISGTGSATYVSVGSGLTEGSEHRIVIKPATVDWGWGRAFGFHTTGAQAYIKELIHDSYKCYAVSRTSTGNYYKAGTYTGCTNLINSYEKLPTSVETVGDYYMKECYAGCTGLITAFWEILPADATVGEDYRHSQYTGCTALEEYQGLAGFVGETYPTNYRNNMLAGAGNDMNIYITRYEALPDGTVYTKDSLGYTDGYSLYTITKAGTYNFTCGVYEGGSQGATEGIVMKNGSQIGRGYASNRGVTVPINTNFSANVGDVISMAVKQRSYGSGSCKNIKISYTTNVLGIDGDRTNGIYVCGRDIETYKQNTNWMTLASEFKVWYWHYVCYSFEDINKYTKLLASITVANPSPSLTLNVFGRGVALKRDASEFAIAGLEYYLDSTGNNHVGDIRYTPTWETVDGDMVLKALTYKGQTSWAGSNTSGSNISYAGGFAFAEDGTLYGHYAYNGSNYDYAGERYILTQQTSGDQTVAGAISRDGKYLWGYAAGFKKWDLENLPSYTTPSTIYGSLVFSDDGMKMIVGSGQRTQLIQYNLSQPWETDTKVSTGKTLNIYGTVCFSSDFKYLFVWNEITKTLSQYTYEN